MSADGQFGDCADLGVLESNLDGGIYARAAIGLVVLASDQTVEHEFRQIMRQPGVALYHARILNDNEITPETLRAMGARIAPTADLILPGVEMDVLAYGCTSATMEMGEERIFAELAKARPNARYTTPVTGALAAFEALGLKRIALLTPYSPNINAGMRRYFEGRGVQVSAMGTFMRTNDLDAARISPESMKAAARAAMARDDVDGVFVSCTSLRIAEYAAEIESETGKPITSSNHAMAWHCLRLAGVEEKQPEFGRLFEN